MQLPRQYCQPLHSVFCPSRAYKVGEDGFLTRQPCGDGLMERGKGSTQNPFSSAPFGDSREVQSADAAYRSNPLAKVSTVENQQLTSEVPINLVLSVNRVTGLFQILDGAFFTPRL